MADWDVIIIGLGGVGSAAAHHCALSGQKVLGIEQFAPAHDRGSSHGQTRIIRQAYFEHPSYVPLLQRAYDLWDDLESQGNVKLFERTGLVEAGPTDGVVIPGVLASAREHGLSIDELTRKEVAERWPGLDGDADWKFVVENNAGFLRVESCVEANLAVAERLGANLRFQQRVQQWRAAQDAVEVFTESGVERAAQLIIAGGAWSGQLINSLGIPLQILRKHLYWFEADEKTYDVRAGFPCFFHEMPTGYFYGFPSVDGRGVKVARHSGGQELEQPVHSSDRDASDQSLCEQYVRQCLPEVRDQIVSHATCFYTTTPDEHFVIDRHPQHPNVTLIAGLSGHGFKFTSVLGEIASQLSRGEPTLDLQRFAISRFSGAANG